MVERKNKQPQIVVLNTNLMRRGDNDEEAAEQWSWLNKTLYEFQKKEKTVS